MLSATFELRHIRNSLVIEDADGRAFVLDQYAKENFGNTHPLEIGGRRITFTECGTDLDDYASERGLSHVKIAGVFGLADLAGLSIALDVGNKTCTFANEGAHTFDIATITAKRVQRRWAADVCVGGRSLTLEIDFARRHSYLPAELVDESVLPFRSKVAAAFGNMSTFLTVGWALSGPECAPIAGLDGLLGCGEFLDQFQLILQQSPSRDLIQVMLLDHAIFSRSTAERGITEETIQAVS
jgi:hypothetical protein